MKAVEEKNEAMLGPRDDMVMHPLHYTANGEIECIDAIRASMRDDQYEGFLRGQCMKYLWRYRLKGNPIRDLKKGMFYWGRLMDLVGDLKYNHQD
jgi:hypothetical protein